MADLGAIADILDIFHDAQTSQTASVTQASGADVLPDNGGYTYVVNNTEIVEGVTTTRHFLPW